MPRPIEETELVSRTRIMQAFGLQWRDIQPMLDKANIQPLPLAPDRKQPRYLGGAVLSALANYGKQ